MKIGLEGLSVLKPGRYSSARLSLNATINRISARLRISMKETSISHTKQSHHNFGLKSLVKEGCPTKAFSNHLKLFIVKTLESFVFAYSVGLMHITIPHVFS